VQRNRERALTGDEIELLKRTVCKGASNDEFALFLWTCRKHKLDPITRQIYAVMRNVTKHHTDEKGIWVAGKQMTIQMGIDGLRALAGRHHKDFGGCDEPQFVMSGIKTPAGKPIPESATIRLWKKGLEHPIVGVAYWDEFAPRDLTESKADFYNRMPRLMLAKCAEAQAIRKGYPDLSDIYTSEEMVQADQDYTEGGRIITDANGFTPSGQPVTYEAHRQLGKQRQQEVLDEKLAHGHEPGSEKAKQAEAALARVEAADAELVGAKAAKTTASDQPETQNAAIDIAAPQSPNGTIELDLTDANDPIIRGDLGNLLDLIQKHCTAKWAGDWWHILPSDVATIHAMAQQLNYRVIEILPKQVPPQGKGVAQNKAASSAAQSAAAPTTSRKETNSKPTASAGSVPSASTAPSIVKGTIQHFTEKMTKGSARKPSAPYMNVLIKTESGDRWYSAFDRDLFEYVSKAKGKSGEFLVTQNGDFWNLVGFKMLAGREFDGKVPVIQKDRAPGREGTLFNP